MKENVTCAVFVGVALALLLAVGCGGAAPSAPPAPLPLIASASASSAPPAAPAAPVDARDAWTWRCDVGHSGGQEIYVAARDLGSTFQIATGDALTGPFELVDKDSGARPQRSVLEGADLDNVDLGRALLVAGVQRADVAKMTVYGVYLHGGWSFGLAVFHDKAGKDIGHVGWAMGVGFARPCAPKG